MMEEGRKEEDEWKVKTALGGTPQAKQSQA